MFKLGFICKLNFEICFQISSFTKNSVPSIENTIFFYIVQGFDIVDSSYCFLFFKARKVPLVLGLDCRGISCSPSYHPDSKLHYNWQWAPEIEPSIIYSSLCELFPIENIFLFYSLVLKHIFFPILKTN